MVVADEEVERVGRAIAGRLSDFGITLEPSVLRSAARAALSARSGEVALREALEPFVRHYESWMDKHADDVETSIFARVTYGDLRRARAALKEAGR